MLTLHAAGGVAGPQRRRVLSVRFLGDDIVHAPRPWATSPPFPGLADELPAGAPMDHPLFPVLCRRRSAVTEPIDYVELPGGDLPAPRRSTAPPSAGASSTTARVRGDRRRRARRRPRRSDADRPAPLVILKADDLEGALARVEAAGGVITEPIFEFPGGRRFHFRDPAGNVLGVWAE